jgi:asparagine synthase (glutamine-hydrolysing)
MLPRLNGMWAFALWDQQEQELILCRDRLGVKPLYYTFYQESWYFASEPKALFTMGLPQEIDSEAVKEHFIFRYLEGKKTLNKGVEKLLPGHYAKIKGAEIKLIRWWNLMEASNALVLPKNPLDWFDELFRDSLRFRMVSDVPVGVLLSAGLDSSSVALGLKENGCENIHTFTIKFNEVEHNEGHLAVKLADYLGFKNHQLLLQGAELLEATKRATWAADQPLVHQNDGHLVAISALASEHVKVLLSGEGADELMGGYVRYKPFRHLKALQLMRQILPLLPTNHYRLDKLKRFLFTNDPDTLMMWSANNFFPSDLKALGLAFEERTTYREEVLQEAKQLRHNDPVKRLLYLEQHTYLQSLLDRNDTTTMMSGIECREPFLDYRIVEGLMSLPSNYFIRGKKGKFVLSNSTGKRLPKEIQEFRKIGLSVPWSKVIRNDASSREILTSSDELENILGISFNSMKKDFLKGNDANQMIMRYLYFYNIWRSQNK